jgi:hypothetical protein
MEYTVGARMGCGNVMQRSRLSLGAYAGVIPGANT